MFASDSQHASLAEQGSCAQQVAWPRWEDEQTPFAVLGFKGWRVVPNTQSPAAPREREQGVKQR